MESVIPDIGGLIQLFKNPNTLAIPFWLSFCLLILITLLKYFVSKESDKADWGNFILEFPIDVCLIIVTIIVTGFMKEPNLNYGMMLVFISLIIIVVCCMFRQASIKHSYKANLKYSFLFGFLNFLVAGSWIFLVYYNII